jgi:hypothetical protein
MFAFLSVFSLPLLFLSSVLLWKMPLCLSMHTTLTHDSENDMNFIVFRHSI